MAPQHTERQGRGTLNPTQLNQTQLNPTQLNPTQLNPTQLNPTQLNPAPTTLTSTLSNATRKRALSASAASTLTTEGASTHKRTRDGTIVPFAPPAISNPAANIPAANSLIIDPLLTCPSVGLSASLQDHIGCRCNTFNLFPSRRKPSILCQAYTWQDCVEAKRSRPYCRARRACTDGHRLYVLEQRK